MKRHWLILCCCLIVASWVPLPGGTVDYLEPKLLTGSIYDKLGGNLLFTFRRTATQTGAVVRVRRDFYGSDGSLAAREEVLYDGGRLARFEVRDLQGGAQGQALTQLDSSGREQIDFDYRIGPSSGSKHKRNSETLREPALISDMLPAFIAEHWEELSRGSVVKFRYIVVPRCETIGFALSRESAGDFQGRKVVRLTMRPASWVISRLVEPLSFTVEADSPHRILQYWGRTTPRIRRDDSWHDLDALTIFNWK